MAVLVFLFIHPASSLIVNKMKCNVVVVWLTISLWIVNLCSAIQEPLTNWKPPTLKDRNQRHHRVPHSYKFQEELKHTKRVSETSPDNEKTPENIPDGLQNLNNANALKTGGAPELTSRDILGNVKTSIEDDGKHSNITTKIENEKMNLEDVEKSLNGIMRAKPLERINDNAEKDKPPRLIKNGHVKDPSKIHETPKVSLLQMDPKSNIEVKEEDAKQHEENERKQSTTTISLVDKDLPNHNAPKDENLSDIGRKIDDIKGPKNPKGTFSNEEAKLLRSTGKIHQDNERRVDAKHPVIISNSGIHKYSDNETEKDRIIKDFIGGLKPLNTNKPLKIISKKMIEFIKNNVGQSDGGISDNTRDKTKDTKMNDLPLGMMESTTVKEHIAIVNTKFDHDQLGHLPTPNLSQDNNMKGKDVLATGFSKFGGKGPKMMTTTVASITASTPVAPLKPVHHLSLPKKGKMRSSGIDLIQQTHKSTQMRAKNPEGKLGKDQFINAMLPMIGQSKDEKEMHDLFGILSKDSFKEASKGKSDDHNIKSEHTIDILQNRGNENDKFNLPNLSRDLSEQLSSTKRPNSLLESKSSPSVQSKSPDNTIKTTAPAMQFPKGRMETDKNLLDPVAFKNNLDGSHKLESALSELRLNQKHSLLDAPDEITNLNRKRSREYKWLDDPQMESLAVKGSHITDSEEPEKDFKHSAKHLRINDKLKKIFGKPGWGKEPKWVDAVKGPKEHENNNKPDLLHMKDDFLRNNKMPGWEKEPKWADKVLMETDPLRGIDIKELKPVDKIEKKPGWSKEPKWTDKKSVHADAVKGPLQSENVNNEPKSLDYKKSKGGPNWKKEHKWTDHDSVKAEAVKGPYLRSLLDNDDQHSDKKPGWNPKPNWTDKDSAKADAVKGQSQYDHINDVMKGPHIPETVHRLLLENKKPGWDKKPKWTDKNVLESIAVKGNHKNSKWSDDKSLHSSAVLGRPESFEMNYHMRVNDMGSSEDGNHLIMPSDESFTFPKPIDINLDRLNETGSGNGLLTDYSKKDWEVPYDANTNLSIDHQTEPPHTIQQTTLPDLFEIAKHEGMLQNDPVKLFMPHQIFENFPKKNQMENPKSDPKKQHKNAKFADKNSFYGKLLQAATHLNVPDGSLGGLVLPQSLNETAATHDEKKSENPLKPNLNIQVNISHEETEKPKNILPELNLTATTNLDTNDVEKGSENKSKQQNKTHEEGDKETAHHEPKIKNGFKSLVVNNGEKNQVENQSKQLDKGHEQVENQSKQLGKGHEQVENQSKQLDKGHEQVESDKGKIESEHQKNNFDAMTPANTSDREKSHELADSFHGENQNKLHEYPEEHKLETEHHERDEIAKLQEQLLHEIMNTTMNTTTTDNHQKDEESSHHHVGSSMADLFREKNHPGDTGHVDQERPREIQHPEFPPLDQPHKEVSTSSTSKIIPTTPASITSFSTMATTTITQSAASPSTSFPIDILNDVVDRMPLGMGRIQLERVSPIFDPVIQQLHGQESQIDKRPISRIVNEIWHPIASSSQTLEKPLSKFPQSTPVLVNKVERLKYLTNLTLPKPYSEYKLDPTKLRDYQLLNEHQIAEYKLSEERRRLQQPDILYPQPPIPYGRMAPLTHNLNQPDILYPQPPIPYGRMAPFTHKLNQPQIEIIPQPYAPSYQYPNLVGKYEDGYKDTLVANPAPYDSKRAALLTQLNNLRMLSNATERMTDQVHRVLLQKMAPNLVRSTDQLDYKFKKDQNRARVINWKIENQGKQTIIIL